MLNLVKKILHRNEKRRLQKALRHTGKLLSKSQYREALLSWKSISSFDVALSPKLVYETAGNLFQKIVSNNLAFSEIKIESDLVSMLCYQEPKFFDNYSTICNILFFNKARNEEFFPKLIEYLTFFIKEKQLLRNNENVASACLLISFSLVNRDQKTILMKKFFNDFFTYQQWEMILLPDFKGTTIFAPTVVMSENLVIFRELIEADSYLLQNKSAEEIFKYLRLLFTTHFSFYKKLLPSVKNLVLEKNNHLPDYKKSLEYLASDKDLYLEYIGSKAKPALIPTLPQKLKIAVCVTGQLRGYKKAFASWNNFFNGADVTYFVHSWQNIGRRYPNPLGASRTLSGKFLQEWKNAWIELGEKKMKKRYENLFELFSNKGVATEAELKSFYNAQEVILEDENSEKFKDFSNPKKMYYKIHECHQLAKNSSQDFDLFIRIRPDKELVLTQPINWNEIYQSLTKSRCIIADLALHVHPTARYVMGDQLAIGTPEIMDRYAATYNLTNYANEKGLAGFPPEYLGHVNFSHSMLYHNIEVKKLEQLSYDLNLVDVELLSAKEVLLALKSDIKNSNHPIDLALLNTAQSDCKNSGF